MKTLTLSPNWLDENIQSAKRQMNKLNLAMRDSDMVEEKKKVDPNLTIPVDDNPERPEIDPDKPKKDKKGKK